MQKQSENGLQQTNINVENKLMPTKVGNYINIVVAELALPASFKFIDIKLTKAVIASPKGAAISRLIKWVYFILITSCLSFNYLYSQNTQTTISYPIYVCTANNPNDYRLFANGSGWDGFWYVGYNRFWVEDIFVPESFSSYKRVFIGTKLGRMKSTQVYKNGKATLDKEAIPGDFYMAISSTPSWKKSSWKFLTTTADIPFEGDGELAVEQVGESQWFWTEIPIKEISFGSDNYIVLWSTSVYLTDSSNSPILAAAWGGKEPDSFLSDGIKGEPPQFYSTATLKSALTVFKPAIAIKFVPDLAQNITVGLMNIVADEKISEKKVVYASVLGNEIEKVWLETSASNKKWKKHGLTIYTAPYMLSINPKKLLDENVQPTDKKKPESSTGFYIRVCATDVWENIGISPSLRIFVIDKTDKK
ncbi:MAG: hypothetical protein PHE88_10015 [Elusimicrobia bacterium]|nr:hypothetical protein [Elusimicrobiota bacterium]